MAHTMRLFLFGAPYLEREGRLIETDTRKAVALLAYLALGESRPGEAGYHRESLAALLYPEADESSARGALRRTLSTLRKALGGEVLGSEHERVMLQPGSLWVDVSQFRQALAGTRTHGHAPAQVCPVCLPLLEEAAALYRDGFMAGFSLRDSPSFDDWQFFLSEALRTELAGGLKKLSYGLAAQGDFAAAASHARRWLALDALSEEAHQQLMLIYAWDGQRNAALRQYRECVRILSQELGVAPLEETTQVYQAVLERRLPPRPVLASPPAKGPDQPAAMEASLPASPAPRPAGSGYPFVGRTAQLERLLKAYSTAGRQGFLCVLEGEAGIGKSRLAEEFLRQVMALQPAQAGGEGMAVLRARCYEGEAGLAYAPFLDGLNSAIARPEAARRLQGSPPGTLSLAAQLTPALAELFPDLPAPLSPSTPGAQARFFDAMRAVMRLLVTPQSSGTGEAPLGVIFLDDLQWADQASLDLLSYLTRRLEGIFLLATWRTDLVPADHRLRHMLAQAARDGHALSLSLERLSAQDIRELLSGAEVPLDSQLAEALFQDSQGNPFFVTAYLEAYLIHRPVGGGAGSEMPLSVRSLLLDRLAPVGEVAAQLLSAAAVLGRSFDFNTLRSVSGRAELETITALEELLQRGLVWERLPPPAGEAQPGEVVYNFTHDKLGELVYDQTSLARRRLLHQRCAEAFTGRARLRREEVALAAHHYRQAGLLPQAAESYRQAGEYSRQVYANQDAIAHYQNALACGHPQPAMLHEVIGDLHSLAGRYLAALSSYETAAALGAAQRLPWVEHKLGRVQSRRGDFELAECHLRAALDELDALPAGVPQAQAERAMLLAELSQVVQHREGQAQALELAGQALSLAQACQDASALAQAYNNLGLLERAGGLLSQAIPHLQSSLEIAENLGDPDLRIAALNNLARLVAESGQFEQAISLTRQALDLCQSRGDRHRQAALLNNMADLQHAAGNEQASMEYLQKAVVIFAEIGAEPAASGEQAAEAAEPGLLPGIWKLSEW